MFTFVHIFYNLIGRLASDGQDFFTSYDEVCESFDAMGLQENLLRGLYAYGKYLEAVLVLPKCEGGMSSHAADFCGNLSFKDVKLFFVL